MQQAITPMQARSHAQCVQRDRSAQTRMALGSSIVWLGPIPWQDPPCAQTVQQDTLVLRQTVTPSLPVPQAPIPLGKRALVLPALLEGQSHMYFFAESKKYCLVCLQFCTNSCECINNHDDVGLSVITFWTEFHGLLGPHQV